MKYCPTLLRQDAKKESFGNTENIQSPKTADLHLNESFLTGSGFNTSLGPQQKIMIDPYIVYLSGTIVASMAPA